MVLVGVRTDDVTEEPQSPELNLLLSRAEADFLVGVSGVLGTGNSDFLLVSSFPLVGLSLVPIKLISHKPWWTSPHRPEDALPPMAEW